MPILAAFAFANLKSDLAALWGWLCHRSFWQLVAMGLAGFVLLQHFQLADARHDRDALQSQLAKIVAAQKDATAKNKAEVAAKEANSQRISDNAKSAYQTDLARLRADNQRLRSHPQGSADKPGVSRAGPTAQGTDADGLRLSPDEHLQAQEIELRLMWLQNWVDEQVKATNSP